MKALLAYLLFGIVAVNAAGYVAQGAFKGLEAQQAARAEAINELLN